MLKNSELIWLLFAEDLAKENPELSGLFWGKLYNAYANLFNENKKIAYWKLINKLLVNSPESKEKLIIDPDSNEIFKK
jgi:hypothetical protein